MCEPKTLPVPTANTNNSGETFVVVNKGDTIPAAVIPATDAEPMATRKIAVTTHANIRGEMLHLLLKLVIYAPVPLSIITCLNTPPAVIMSKIIAILEIPLLSICIISVHDDLL